MNLDLLPFFIGAVVVGLGALALVGVRFLGEHKEWESQINEANRVKAKHLSVLYEQLAIYEKAGSVTLHDSDPQRHRVWAQCYHDTAEEIFNLTGVDPRPVE